MSAYPPPIYFFPGIIFNDAYFIASSASSSSSGVSQTYVDTTFLKKAGDTATGLITFSAGESVLSQINLNTTPFITWNPAGQSYIINDSLTSTMTGTNNTAYGHTCADALTSGSFNSFYGYNSGTKTTSGSNNTFYGRGSGRDTTIGTYNVFVGDQAGLTATGSYNSILGASLDTGTYSNTSLIGYGSSATGSNQVVLGSSAETVRVPGALSFKVTDDNTNGTYYLPFVKTVATEGQLYVDSVTGPLTYNPSTSTITCASYDGPSATANVSFASSTTSGILNIGINVQGSQTCSFISNGGYNGTINVLGGSVSSYMYIRGNLRTQYGIRTSTVTYTFQNDNLGYRIFPTLNWGTGSIGTAVTNATSFTIDGTTIAYGVYNVNILLNILSGGTAGLIYASLSTTSVTHQSPMTYNYYQASTQQSSQINWTISVYASTTFYVVVNSSVGVSGTIQTSGANTSTILLTRIG